MSIKNFNDLDKELQGYGIHKHERDKKINEYKKEWKEFEAIYSRSYELIKRDLEIMYDTFIDQFYKYKTRSYIRHDTSKPGVGYGWNLYRANNITVNDFSVEFNINAKDMKGGYKYRPRSKEEVLDQVLNGYRFNYAGIEIPWFGSYKSEISNFEIYGATIDEAFNEYAENFDDILKYIFIQCCKQG